MRSLGGQLRSSGNNASPGRRSPSHISNIFFAMASGLCPRLREPDSPVAACHPIAQHAPNGPAQVDGPLGAGGVEACSNAASRRQSQGSACRASIRP